MPYNIHRPPKEIIRRIKRHCPDATNNDIMRFMNVFNTLISSGSSHLDSFSIAWDSISNDKYIKRNDRTNKLNNNNAKQGELCKLSALSNSLLSLGLKEESLFLSGIINKISQYIGGDEMALESIWSLPNEEDEDIIENGRIGNEDEPTEKWYDSVQYLGTSIILIPFDQKNLSIGTLKKLLNVFNIDSSDLISSDKIKEFTAYTIFANTSRLFQRLNKAEDKNILGDLNVFKNEFPSLWNAISSTLNSKKLNESEVVYMLHSSLSGYDPDSLRNAFYFAHDIGHIEEEMPLIKDNKIFETIFKYIKDIARNYIYSKDPTGQTNLTDVVMNYNKFNHGEFGGNYYNDRYFEYLLRMFFDIISEGGDEISDVYANALAGDMKYNRPKRIYYQDKEFIPNEDDSELSALESNMISEVMNKISDKKNGPLSRYKGHVVLFEI
jgi:hypothetical protein